MYAIKLRLRFELLVFIFANYTRCTFILDMYLFNLHEPKIGNIKKPQLDKTKNYYNNSKDYTKYMGFAVNA